VLPQQLAASARSALLGAAEGSLAGRCLRLLEQQLALPPRQPPLLSLLQYQHRAQSLLQRQLRPPNLACSPSAAGAGRAAAAAACGRWRAAPPGARLWLGGRGPLLPPRPPAAHPRPASSSSRAFTSTAAARSWRQALSATAWRASDTTLTSTLRQSGDSLGAAWQQLAPQCPAWLVQSTSTAQIFLLNALTLVNGQRRRAALPLPCPACFAQRSVAQRSAA
jgi:hypothetical protein